MKRNLQGRPGGAWWLMQHELRLFWRGGKARSKAGTIFVGIALLFWLGMMLFLFSKLGGILPEPPLGDDNPDERIRFAEGAALAAIDVVLAFISSVMISQGILKAVDVIYTRNDLDLLMSSPLKPWTVLIVRSSAIAIGSLPLYAGFLVPPLLSLAIFNSPLWLTGIVMLAGLAFGATGLALLIVTGLFRILGAKQTRMVAQIFAALSGAAVFLGFQYFNLAAPKGGRSSEQWVSWFRSLRIDTDSPLLIPARAMTGDLLAVFIMIVVFGGLFILGVFVFSRRFVSDAAAASVMGPSRRTADTRVRAVKGGVTSSIVRKEMRLLVRDPVLLSQIGLQLVYLLPLAYILVVGVGSGRPAFMPQAIPSVLALLASSLAGSLTWLSVSAEDAPDLIASAPVPHRLVDRAKLIAALAPVFALMAIPVAALAVASPAAGAWAAVGVIASAFASGFIGLWRRTPGQRRSFIRRRGQGSVTSSLGQTFVGIGLSFTVGLGAYGLPWLAIVPAVISAALLMGLYKETPAPGEEPAPNTEARKGRRLREVPKDFKLSPKP
jgi:ABC-2 type transport system permease protein